MSPRCSNYAREVDLDNGWLMTFSDGVERLLLCDVKLGCHYCGEEWYFLELNYRRFYFLLSRVGCHLLDKDPLRPCRAAPYRHIFIPFGGYLKQVVLRPPNAFSGSPMFLTITHMTCETFTVAQSHH